MVALKNFSERAWELGNFNRIRLLKGGARLEQLFCTTLANSQMWTSLLETKFDRKALLFWKHFSHTYFSFPFYICSQLLSVSRAASTSTTILLNFEREFNSFMTEVPHHIETSPLICRANQWPGFYDKDFRHERV